MEKEVEKLQEIIDTHDNIVFFGGRRCIYGKRYSGFQKSGRDLSSEV